MDPETASPPGDTLEMTVEFAKTYHLLLLKATFQLGPGRYETTSEDLGVRHLDLCFVLLQDSGSPGT